MTDIPIVSQFVSVAPPFHLLFRRNGHGRQPTLLASCQFPDRLPWFVHESPVAMRYLDLLGLLTWEQFPERDLERNYGQQATPYAAFVAACLVKIDQSIRP